MLLRGALLVPSSLRSSLVVEEHAAQVTSAHNHGVGIRACPLDFLFRTLPTASVELDQSGKGDKKHIPLTPDPSSLNRHNLLPFSAPCIGHPRYIINLASNLH